MNVNTLNKTENELKKFLSLKEENEDNLIENKSKNININAKDEEMKINEPVKFKLNYNYLLEYINTSREKNIDDQNEFFYNLLLMPSEIDLKNKLRTLSNLVTFYKRINQKKLLIRANGKIEKIMNSLKDIDKSYYIFPFYITSNILLENDQNYFYAFKYIKRCANLINDMKDNISESDSSKIMSEMNLISQSAISYIDSKKIIFSDISKKELFDKISNLTDLIINEQNNKETDKDDENKKYLYAINKDWILSLSGFIKQFKNLTSEEGKNNENLIENCFNFQYICEAYLKEEKNKLDFYPFPGPINNFQITSLKDSWKFKVNLDENDYIKKNAEYFLVNYDDWNFLSQTFGDTNLIRRKKDNLDLISLKFILFDKRISANKKNLNLLKERKIQFNKGINMKQLKKKIIACVNNTLKATKKSKQICFFILDEENRNLLIEIAFGFVLDIQMYESLYLKKIECRDEDNLEHFFSKFDKRKHILLIEIIQEDDLNYLVQIDRENLKCASCCKKIKDEKEINKCDYCHYSLFCSKTCANNSKEHKLLDKKLNQIMEKKFELSDITSEKYDYLLKNGNYGRTEISVESEDESFFTSSIHCLSNTLSLTKYFLLKSFSEEKRDEIKNGISDFYYRIIKGLWDYGNKKISIGVQDFCKKLNIMNINNADPYTFIYYLLNQLNEELNRASGKFNEEIQEQQEGESDEETSRRFTSFNKKKKNSIITDLFLGQYKETAKCINCGTISIKFPNFIRLSVPLPDKKSNIQIKLFKNNLNYYYVNVKINENTEMKDFLFEAMEYLNLNKSSYIKYLLNNKTKEGIFNYNISDVPESILYNSLQFVEVNKDFKIINIHHTSYSNIPMDKKNNKNIYFNGTSLISFDNLKYKEYMEKKNISELIIYEKDINSIKPNYITVYIYPVTEVEKETLFLTIKKAHKILSYPVLITINKNFSLEDLNALVFNKLKKALSSQFQNHPDSINLYFPHFDSSWERYKAKEKKCPICQKPYSKDIFCCCLFDGIDKTSKISDLMEKQGNGRPLILFAKTDVYERKNEIYKGMDLFFEKNNEIETKDVISLYDCLDCFNTPKINNDEENFCKNCNAVRQFKRELNIYKCPIYLILKLDRHIQQGKNDKFVEYKEILDLKDYVLGPDKKKAIYILYAVLLHKKSLNSSNYFCYCKNFGYWICYSAEGIERIESPINKDAYILFYKKRSIE